uniref:Uncharacterized protein n=1 Tax=Cacopsylla melanoneura TaxID=428564 RepID=A0A8D9AY06_9HEMI
MNILGSAKYPHSVDGEELGQREGGTLKELLHTKYCTPMPIRVKLYYDWATPSFRLSSAQPVTSGHNLFTKVEFQPLFQDLHYMGEALLLIVILVGCLRYTTQQQTHSPAILFRVVHSLLHVGLSFLKLHLSLFQVSLALLDGTKGSFHFPYFLHHHALENLESSLEYCQGCGHLRVITRSLYERQAVLKLLQLCLNVLNPVEIHFVTGYSILVVAAQYTEESNSRTCLLSTQKSTLKKAGNCLSVLEIN